jgi:hypothetical protein
MMQHVIRVLNGTGDEALATWDPADEITTEVARKRFDELVVNGYLTFRADEGTRNTGTRIKEFDPEAKTIFVFLKKNFAGG